MLIHPLNVFILICVEAIITLVVEHAHVRLTTCLIAVHPVILLLLPLLNIEKVDGFVLENLSFFHVPQVWAKHLEGLLWAHRESIIVVRSSSAVLLISQRGHFGIDQLTVFAGDHSCRVQGDIRLDLTTSPRAHAPRTVGTHRLSQLSHGVQMVIEVIIVCLARPRLVY